LVVTIKKDSGQASFSKYDVNALCSSLLPNWRSIPDAELWPPEVFALCISILTATGLYANIVSTLRPGKIWPQTAMSVGISWVEKLAKGEAPPSNVLEAWKQLKDGLSILISDIHKNGQFVTRLFALIGYCDETCGGIGIPGPGLLPAIQDRAIGHLRDWGTLTPRIPPSRCRILPKQHTPGVGLTPRSLTHNLAYHPNSEVDVNWVWAPRLHHDRFNILLAPWPRSIKPTDFKAHSNKHIFANAVNEFDYAPKNSSEVINWGMELLKVAEADAGPIDALVFPELALSRQQFNKLALALREKDIILIAGVRDVRSIDSVNTVCIDLNQRMSMPIIQAKHHRWKLDCGQISNYGLGGVLNPSEDWWEATPPVNRGVNFVCASPDLAFCCLVCEDLARQEPVASLVRSVAPNLVIALLMDGPQVDNRWAARYATVLAEDPGSSVLSLTSLGMAKLANSFASSPKRRTIALWKDKDRPTIELSLPDGAEGLVLHTRPEFMEEVTADGRPDNGVAAFPRLRGWHPVYLQWPRPTRGKA
jgi:hypothetical protein